MKTLTALLTAMLLVVPGTSDAEAIFGSKKKKAKAAAATAQAPAPKKSNYAKIVDDPKCQTSRSEFISTHILGDKLYFEIPLKYMEREYLLGTKTSETNTPGTPDHGMLPANPIHLTIILQDSTVYFEKVNPATYDLPDEESFDIARKRNFINPIFEKYKVEAYNADSTAVLVNVTDLFTKEVKDMMPIKSGGTTIKTTVRFEPKLSKLINAKSFEDNVMVETDMTFEHRTTLSDGTEMGSGTLRTKLKRTLLLLPEKRMHPRVADHRVGIFLVSGKRKIDYDKDYIQTYALAKRWKLEPSDTAAYRRGDLVEPAKPIVFYVDDALPDSWRQPIHRAVTVWNKAFEEIGFKNAVQAVDFPKDDPEFDPDNLKYSCLRYVPIGINNAMGPSWADPKTGEIIHASVVMYSNITNLLFNWRFVQTSQVDERIRTDKMPKDIFDECLEYVVAHEIGHTLGFMHNMSASAAYPVDSLRSPGFTQKYGTTASIMDYARFNYVAQPEDKGVRLLPPDLGEYDYYTVKWLYTPFFDMTPKEEEMLLQSWVDEKAGDPIYRYGMQQMASMYDPSSQTEDLGDDAIKASDYGIKNLKYILPQYGSWIGNDPAYRQREIVYNEITGQYIRYINHVLTNVGGIYLTNIKEGDPVDRYRSVPKDIQKKSMRWVINELHNCSWIDDLPMRSSFSPAVAPSVQRIVNSIHTRVHNLSENVALSAYFSDDPYTMKEFYDDMFDLYFGKTAKGQKLTDADKLMQRAYVTSSLRLTVNNLGNGPANIQEDGITLADVFARGIECNGMFPYYADRLREMADNDPSLLELRLDPETDLGHENGYGYQGRIRSYGIYENAAYDIDMRNKAISTIKRRLPSAHADDKPHYQMMLEVLEQQPTPRR